MWYIIYETTVVVVIVEVVVALVVAFVVIRLILLVKCSHISIYMSFFCQFLAPDEWSRSVWNSMQHQSFTMYASYTERKRERDKRNWNKNGKNENHIQFEFSQTCNLNIIFLSFLVYQTNWAAFTDIGTGTVCTVCSIILHLHFIPSSHQNNIILRIEN